MIRNLLFASLILPLLFDSSQGKHYVAPPISVLQNANRSELEEAARLAKEVVELYKQSKYQEALPLAKRCLQIREKSFKPSDELLRNAWTNLAEVYIALGKYGNAEPLLKLLINSYEQDPLASARLPEALQRMALVEFANGNPTKAENLYQRAIQITEKQFGSNDGHVASAIFYLAELYQLTGEYKKAEPLYKRVVAIREKESPAAVSEPLQEALDRYSCVLYKMKRADEAQQVESRAFGWMQFAPGGSSADSIMGAVLNGKAISLPKPHYPDAAKAARASGTVVVRVVIDETGKVISACAVQGPATLSRTSELAARLALFTPTKISGQPVKVTGIINYNFVYR